MATVEAGKLAHRVQLLRLTSTRDRAGGVVQTWTQFAEVWAEVVPFTGRELIAAEALEAETDTRVRIRYRPDVDSGVRVRWRGREMEARSVINVGGVDVMLEILCTSRQE